MKLFSVFFSAVGFVVLFSGDKSIIPALREKLSGAEVADKKFFENKIKD